MKRLALALAICLALTLAGCGGQAPAPAETTTPPAAETAAPVETAEKSDGAVTSIAEMLEAIRPDAHIVLAPGTYNLSGFFIDVDVAAWNGTHRYVHLRECYDGYEVVICRADGLVLSGGTDSMADTEIVTDPRYAAVLRFEDCRDIIVSRMTMGHTDAGECVGSVLCFDQCMDVSLHDLDLYGCGVYAISACEGTARLTAENCTLRDCTFGPFEVYDCVDYVSFDRCAMTGSRLGGYFEPSDDYTLYLTECVLGQEESNRWYFDEDAVIVDCRMMEPTIYPDYGEYDGE